MADRAPSPRVRAFVRWTLRHGSVLWLVAVLIGIPAAWRTAYLYAHLRSDIEELLPREAPSVRALQELRSRFPGLQYLGVIAEMANADDLVAAEHFLHDLAERIRTYPPELVREVRASNADATTFLEHNAPLYMDLVDLQELRRRLEARRDYEVEKKAGQLLDESEHPPSADTSDIEARYKAKLASASEAHLSSASLKTAMLFVEAGGFDTGADKARDLLGRVQRDVAALEPTRYAPGLRVGYASDVAISAEELQALETDLSVSSLVVVFAVMGVIIVYYRWWRSVLVLIPPLLLATLYAFALASLPPMRITELNSNTAFLGSIIVGNGINVGLILLARYREERLRGASVEDALVVGVWGARTGTLVAAAAAGASYASLIVTEFRGFRQFGYIGAIGMLMSWMTAFLLIPRLIHWFDKDHDRARTLHPDGHRVIMAWLAQGVWRFAPWILVGAAMLAIGSAVQVAKFDTSHLEYDFNKLRRVDTWANGAGYWGNKMDTLLGHYLTPTVILCDTPGEAQAVERLVRDSVDHGALHPFVARVVAADDVFPKDQAAKIQELTRFRKALTPSMRAMLTEDNRKQIERSDAELEPIRIEDLPRLLTTGLRERDGTMGRTVLVYPRPSDALWKADSIRLFVQTLRDFGATANPAKPARVAGSIPLSDDILSSIARDAPLACAVSILGVVAALILLARHVAGYVIAALALGVLWLAGTAMWLHIKINFANFIAFPITFGIGIDYAANVMSRYRQDGERDIRGAVRSTGGAVVLCSLTTIIGYSSLLLAKNRALFLFGLLAVTGEVACLSAAIIVLPAGLALIQRLRAMAPHA